MIRNQEPADRGGEAKRGGECDRGRGAKAPAPRRGRRQEHRPDRKQRAEGLEARHQRQDDKHGEHTARYPARAPTACRKAGSNASTARGRYSAAMASRITLLAAAICQSACRSIASTVPNRTRTRSTLLPRQATSSTPSERATR